jgi:hypothetical protein
VREGRREGHARWVGPGQAVSGPCTGEKGDKAEREGRPWVGPQGEKREGKKERKWAGPNRNRRGKIKVFQMLLNLNLKVEFK